MAALYVHYKVVPELGCQDTQVTKVLTLLLLAGRELSKVPSSICTSC